MYIQQLYTPCLAEAAYYIESNGEAAIIDPLREPDPYLQLAKERGSNIKYIFETHFHADFVSGHLDLSKKTGAEIIYGPTATAKYPITTAKDNQIFELGDIQIKVLHTPGHTLESSCFLVIDNQGQDYAVFTGDTLFVGDVGRPDLAVNANLSREDLARNLYLSLQEKLIPLADHVILYPGHGPGSQCGKALGKETWSTIGAQKKYNYALNVDSEDDFVSRVTEGLSAPPQYFPKNAQINKEGYSSIDNVLEKANTPISVNEISASENVLILDTRSPQEFSAGYIPGSINVGLNGFFAVWVGTLIEDLKTKILLVTPEGKEKETILRLARVGYESVIGYLEGGFTAWKQANKHTDKVSNICPVSFRNNPAHKSVLDVRTLDEYSNGHVDGALSIPLSEIYKHLPNLNKAKVHYVYCKSGYRSMIASSILKRNGFDHIVNVKQGYEGISSKNGCCSVKP